MNTKDFADLIGVSRATLSKVINGKPGVSKKLKEKIEEQIKIHNFVPNNSAQILAGKTNNILGLFLKVPSVALNESIITSHFNSEFTNYAINEVQKKNYKLLVSAIGNDFQEIERSFKSGLISGAILLGYSKSDLDLKKLASEKNKILIINQQASAPSKFVKILNLDNFNGAHKAIEELVIKNNHKNLLYIGSSTPRLSSTQRELSVKNFYEEHRDKFESFRIENGDYTKSSGYDIMKKILLEDKVYPTGVFAANDFMAIGAIEAIKEKNLRVPEDISVIGFDDIDVSKYIDPPLTTIKYDFEDVAKRAVHTLIDFIEGKKVESSQESETTLLIRKSVKNLAE